MCDRILVFSSNPGRIAAEIQVPFPHPRNRLDPAFRQMVDDIYARMTARPSAAGAKGRPHGYLLGSPLPDVSTNEIAGLIETVAREPFSGKADLPVISQELQMGDEELFPIIEVVQHLGFADLAGGDILLTPIARTFAEADVQARKRIFTQQLTAYVPLAAHIKRVLDERPGHRAPRIRFEEELEDYLSDSYAEETLDRVINWARYAEIFAYDDESQMFSLENPTE